MLFKSRARTRGDREKRHNSFRGPSAANVSFDRKVGFAILSVCAITALFFGYHESKEKLPILKMVEASLIAIVWLTPPAIIAWIAKRLALSWKAAFVFTFVVIAFVFHLLRQNST